MSVEGGVFSASTSATILLVGTVLAWSGVVLEAVADYHKFYVKQKNAEKKNEATSTATFVGPTGGVYRITRHPNYTGEVLFWFGQLVGGVPFLGKSVVGWICSLLGFYGIYSIMTMASKRLDKRQQESYSGQSKYDEWRKSTKASIFPFVNDIE
jgi:steroid 5-alpha reductase family enzyme